MRSIVLHLSDLVTLVDAGGRMRYHSPSIEQLLGYLPDEMTDRDLAALVHPEDVAPVRGFLAQSRRNPGAAATIEFRARHRDGSWRQLEAVVNNRLADPAMRAFVVTARDVTQRKHVEDQLKQRAFYDPVTGLANRTLFLDRLARAAAAGRQPGRIAVLFLDLDGFKAVNDELGHAAGDALLAGIGRRLAGCLRPTDTVARFGGDEFTVLIEDVAHQDAALRAAQRITAAVRSPFPIEGRQVAVTASIGIALGPPSPQTAHPQTLLRHADAAVYRAKAAGKDRIVISDPEATAGIAERDELSNDLRRALARGELRLHYQPEIDLETSEVDGIEALVRWAHARRGLLNPSQFLALAEEGDLMPRLGGWVLESACRQAQAWQREHRRRPLMVSVNLSAHQIAQADLAEQVDRALRRTRLAPELLRLEIAEHALAAEAPATERTLHDLRSLGVRLTLDDFGAGSLPLRALQRFPLDALKIDRSFISDIEQDERAVSLVRAVSALAHTLGMDVTAAGIETAEQLARVRSVDCTRGQGFYFAAPLAPEQAGEMLRLRR